MGSSRRRAERGARWLTLAVLLAGGLFGGGGASAEDQHVLLGMLSADSFRVRARAALALARTGDAQAISGLERALEDSHPAVRAAAALALGQIGTRRCVPALRAAASDLSPLVASEAKSALRAIAAREVIARAVPASEASARQPAAVALARMRYAVVLGEMRDQSGAQDAGLEALLAARIGEGLRKLGRVAVFSAAEMTEAVAQELARHKLPVFRLEGNLSRLTTLAGESYRMRCEVSLLVLDEPERALRSVMKGAATSSEQSRGTADDTIAQKAVGSAVHSALANAVQAFEAAATQRELATGDIRAEASLKQRH